VAWCLALGKLVAIELDLTPKRTKDFERILRSYQQDAFRPDLVVRAAGHAPEAHQGRG
jgi:hypothetical protein